jgi:hypothetical protein
MSVHGGVLSHLELRACGMCRGVRSVGGKYLPYIFAAVRVMLPICAGVDLIDCYGSESRGLTVWGAKGIAIRTHRSNSFQFHNTRIRSDLTGEYWPDPLEEHVTDIAGNVVQTPDVDRAAIVLANPTHHQDLTWFSGLVMEPIVSGTRPAVSICSQTTRFCNVRFEGGSHSGALFQVRQENGDVRSGSHVGIDGIDIQTKGDRPRYLLHAIGGSRYVTLRDVSAHEYVLDALIACDGGKHYSPTVERALLTRASTQRIVALNGAEIVSVAP